MVQHGADTMAAEDYRAAVKLLPRLTQEELNQLRLRLNAFLTIENGAASTTACIVDDDWLLSGIVAELRRRALWSNGHFPARLLPSGWAQRSAAVRALLLGKVARQSSLRAAEKLALGQVAGRALAEYVSRGGVPLGPRILLSRVDQVPAAIESAFPGYLRAGLLPFCWGAWEAVDV